ncbi:MAG: SHOCT domain-containing protein [Ruminococcus sp.]|nr:SHOCT domain-containing protein [Ruminococcus sp.]
MPLLNCTILCRQHKNGVTEEKKAKKTGYTSVEPNAQSVSSADELKKYNDLLKAGAITQEEYDEIKKKLL